MIKIVEKPWGYEEIWALTDQYAGKKIYIKKGHKLSKQYHKKKEETIFVLKGVLNLEIEYGLEFGEEYTKIMNPGSAYHIKPGTIHRFCAERGDVELIEVSTPELDDVIRLEDDYDRVK